MNIEPEAPIRPTKCHFCGEPMFYHGDERWVPEVRVEAFEYFTSNTRSDFYAHVKCWNERMGK